MKDKSTAIKMATFPTIRIITGFYLEKVIQVTNKLSLEVVLKVEDDKLRKFN